MPQLQAGSLFFSPFLPEPQVEQGYMILNDADVAGDILWAIAVVSRSEDIAITQSNSDWPYMQGVLFGAERGITT